MEYDWIENSNGNWVLIDDGVEATVYEAGDEWSAVWNGAPDGKARRLKAKYSTSEEAIAAVEAAIAEGPNSMRWWPPDDQWLPTKKGGYYRKYNGVVISVKQARSGAWFVTNGSASLGRYGRTTWFTTDAEARLVRSWQRSMAVDTAQRRCLTAASGSTATPSHHNKAKSYLRNNLRPFSSIQRSISATLKWCDGAAWQRAAPTGAPGNLRSRRACGADNRSSIE
jgi:hypothetical protein